MASVIVHGKFLSIVLILAVAQEAEKPDQGGKTPPEPRVHSSHSELVRGFGASVSATGRDISNFLFYTPQFNAFYRVTEAKTNDCYF